MFNKREILETISSDEDRLLLSKTLDQVMLSLKYHEIRFTDYLTLYQQKLVLKNLPKNIGIHMEFWGGYSDAERKLATFFPDYISPSTVQYPIICFQVESKEIHKLSHRDFLGSMLGLGIKREKIGDILVDEEKCFIFVMDAIWEYIKLNLSKVAHSRVTIEQRNINEVEIPQKKFKLIRASVASLRIDSILSAALAVSRSKVIPYIQAQKVYLNWELVKSPAQNLIEGDVFSVRGHGRMELAEVGGLTKKGRIHIAIKKFI